MDGPNSSNISSSSSSSGMASGYWPILVNPTVPMMMPFGTREGGVEKLAIKFEDDQKISYAPLRRDSMTKMDIMENGVEEEEGISNEISQAGTSQASQKKVSFSVQSAPETLLIGQKLICHEIGLPRCLAESQVVREKPSIRTRLLVCFISAIVIVFCLAKLFYWK